MRMTDTPYDAAMSRSKQELARQLVDANAEIERLREKLTAIHEMSQDQNLPWWQVIENIAATAASALHPQ